MHTCRKPESNLPFWKQIAALCDNPESAPPGEMQPMIESIMPLAAYSESALGDVMSTIHHVTNAGSEKWKYLLTYDRKNDLRYAVIPPILKEIRDYATEGDMEKIKLAMAHLYLFYVREGLRTGKLPIMASVYEMPKLPGTLETESVQ